MVCPFFHQGSLLASLLKPTLMRHQVMTEGQQSCRGRAYTQVKGHLEQDGKKLQEPTFGGKWSEVLYAAAVDGTQRQLWQVNPVPANRCAG